MPNILNETQIANIALSHLAGKQLVDKNMDSSIEANLVNLYWDMSLLEVLRAGDWKFASKETELTPSSETSAVWGYAYQYPDDCVAVREIVDPKKTAAGVAAIKIPFEIGLNAEGDGYLIYCDVEGAIARYISLVHSVMLWPPEFVSVFALRLAYNMAFPLSQKEQTKNTIYQLYLQALNQALATSMSEGYRKFSFTSDVLNARRTS